MVASVHDRTGYMELCCECVLTEGVLGQGRMWERREDVLLDSCLLGTGQDIWGYVVYVY